MYILPYASPRPAPGIFKCRWGRTFILSFTEGVDGRGKKEEKLACREGLWKGERENSVRNSMHGEGEGSVSIYGYISTYIRMWVHGHLVREKGIRGIHRQLDIFMSDVL